MYFKQDDPNMKVVYNLPTSKWKFRCIDGSKPKTMAKVLCQPPRRPEFVDPSDSWSILYGYILPHYVSQNGIRINPIEMFSNSSKVAKS